MRSTTDVGDTGGASTAADLQEAGSRQGAGVRSVFRAIDLLNLFDAKHLTRNLPELATLTGLPKTTVVRLVATLRERHLLTVRADGSVSLGPGFLKWARHVAMMWELPESVHELMRELARETGETVNVYIRQDSARLCVAQQEGTATVRNAVELGVPMPLWGGAAGKVLLSDALDLVNEVAGLSPQGAAAAESLYREARAVTEVGYAVSHGERELGASGVAVPITFKGRMVAALALGGPTSRFTAERISGYVTAVTRTGQEISRRELIEIDLFG